MNTIAKVVISVAGLAVASCAVAVAAVAPAVCKSIKNTMDDIENEEKYTNPVYTGYTQDFDAANREFERFMQDVQLENEMEQIHMQNSMNDFMNFANM